MILVFMELENLFLFVVDFTVLFFLFLLFLRVCFIYNKNIK